MAENGAVHTGGAYGKRGHRHQGGRALQKGDAYTHGRGGAQLTFNWHVADWGAHTCPPMIGGTNKGMHGSWEEAIYGLFFSFEVAKYSPHVAPCLAFAP
jgi:hypothetical protein